MTKASEMEEREALIPSPYRIEGPALVSFSGGRTSAYMLHQIVQAHGGTLPANVRVCFANTGKERPETLRFVHECGTRWGVQIDWLEFVNRAGPIEGRYERVNFNSASRNGEPFERLIRLKSFVPNSVMRFCTEEMKVNTLANFVRDFCGWTTWTNVVGLRHDEGHRCLKAYARNDEGRSPWRTVCPLDKAHVTKADVMAFWAAQPFDLGLRSYEGNCDLCFLKGRGALKTIMREQPGAADWWADMERTAKGQFSTDYSYADLAREVAKQPHLFDGVDTDEHDAECGLLCDPEAA